MHAKISTAATVAAMNHIWPDNTSIRTRTRVYNTDYNPVQMKHCTAQPQFYSLVPITHYVLVAVGLKIKRVCRQCASSVLLLFFFFSSAHSLCYLRRVDMHTLTLTIDCRASIELPASFTPITHITQYGVLCAGCRQAHASHIHRTMLKSMQVTVMMATQFSLCAHRTYFCSLSPCVRAQSDDAPTNYYFTAQCFWSRR